MSKQFWIALAVIAVILGGIVVVTNHNKGGSSGSSGEATQHIEGKGSTGVKLVEYGDYECPVCGTFAPTVEQVASKYTDQIYFQFRNLPLTAIHQNAFAGARAAEAAGLQDKYWQMHDLLYQDQSAWSTASDPTSFFDTYATQIGLNLTQFKRDYASEKVNSAINADLAAFAKTGDEQATPTFYLDGTKLDNAKLLGSNGQPSVDAFSKLIDAEIAKKTGGNS
ncbi:MAG TPA: thioredoxin domain-containing protein [Candidatus Saccharimonadales bacterium]|nr:thioredoxin domain-containing protein [Candidatus Saccharimonadales bacterium]